jgi:hypothetical protein
MTGPPFYTCIKYAIMPQSNDSVLLKSLTNILYIHISLYILIIDLNRTDNEKSRGVLDILFQALDQMFL